jgi:hypothetical protein
VKDAEEAAENVSAALRPRRGRNGFTVTGEWLAQRGELQGRRLPDAVIAQQTPRRVDRHPWTHIKWTHIKQGCSSNGSVWQDDVRSETTTGKRTGKKPRSDKAGGRKGGREH